MASFESAAEIIETLRSSGYEISTQQLSEWHRNGLIRRPKQTALGRGRGTESRYPVGTAKQVAALISLRHGTRHNPEYIGWQLWVLGFTISETIWRQPFIDASNELFRLLRAAIDQEILQSQNEIMISEDAIKALETISEERNKSGLFGPVRRSIGRSNYTVLLHALFRVAVGIFESSEQLKDTSPELSAELSAIFKRTIEDPTFLENTLRQFSISATEFEQMLVQISDEFAPLRDTKLIEVFGDEDLINGRNETNILLSALLTASEAENPKPRSLELLMRLLACLTAKQHATLIFIWLIARRVPAVASGLADIVAASNSQHGAPL